MRIIYSDTEYTFWAGDIGTERKIIESEPVEIPSTVPAEEPVPA